MGNTFVCINFDTSSCMTLESLLDTVLNRAQSLLEPNHGFQMGWAEGNFLNLATFWHLTTMMFDRFLESRKIWAQIVLLISIPCALRCSGLTRTITTDSSNPNDKFTRIASTHIIVFSHNYANCVSLNLVQYNRLCGIACSGPVSTEKDSSSVGKLHRAENSFQK